MIENIGDGRCERCICSRCSENRGLFADGKCFLCVKSCNGEKKECPILTNRINIFS